MLFLELPAYLGQPELDSVMASLRPFGQVCRSVWELVRTAPSPGLQQVTWQDGVHPQRTSLAQRQRLASRDACGLGWLGGHLPHLRGMGSPAPRDNKQAKLVEDSSFPSARTLKPCRTAPPSATVASHIYTSSDSGMPGTGLGPLY